MPSSNPKEIIEGHIGVLAQGASLDAIYEVMVMLIKQEARDIKMIHPDVDEKEMYRRAAGIAKQRMIGAIHAACNGRCTGS